MKKKITNVILTIISILAFTIVNIGLPALAHPFPAEPITLLKGNDNEEIYTIIHISIANQSPYFNAKFNNNNSSFRSIGYTSLNLPLHLVKMLAQLLYYKAYPEYYETETRDMISQLNIEEIIKIYIEASEFLLIDLPLLPKLIAQFIHDNDNNYKGKKTTIESYIKHNFDSPTARGEIAKQYFLLYGYVSDNPSYKKKEFLDIDYNYGFSVDELIKNKKIPKFTISNLSVGNFVTLDLQKLNINSLYGINNIPNIRQVELLNLSRNKIETLDANEFDEANPTILNLSYNQIAQLPANVFENQSNLATLYLNNNNIANIDDNAFKGLPDLYYLYLKNNKIESLNTNYRSNLISLKELDI